jgi:regulatory protein
MLYKEIKIKIENWCAYQDRCSFEVREKLKNYDLSDIEKEKLIHELVSSNFIDDKRFAFSFVSGKFKIKNWGKTKIIYQLKQKKVNLDLIYQAIDEIDESEYRDTINKLILKKKKEITKNLTEYELKSKVFNYLSSKGFEIDEVYKCYDLLK